MKFYTTSLLFILMIPLLKAQDVQFSQFYANPIYLAPSYAGSTHGTRLVGNYRDQWPKIPGTYISNSFSVDHFFERYKTGMGLSFFSDNAGAGKLVTYDITYSYSYKAQLMKDLFFQPGLAAYYYSRSINYEKLSFADQFFDSRFIGSTSESLSYERIQHADFAVSGLLYNSFSWGGFTVDHLMNLSPVLRKKNSYSDMRFTLFGGKKFVIRDVLRRTNDDYISVAFKYNYQSQLHQLDLGAYYYKDPLMFGIWYRGTPAGNEYSTSDAIIFLLGVQYRIYTFSYNYDMTINELITSTGGSHEISLTVTLDGSYNKKKKYKALPCPKF